MKDDSRPGSASSFQMMRTEAWRSSASSASTGFPTSAVETRKFIQFVVNEQLNQNKGTQIETIFNTMQKRSYVTQLQIFDLFVLRMFLR